jgi:hypothetical protein
LGCSPAHVIILVIILELSSYGVSLVNLSVCLPAVWASVAVFFVDIDFFH